LGCQECAEDIARAARVKPVSAFIDGISASAAYWITSQASQITATPSAEIGSIGVYSIHTDMAGALAAEGIIPTIIQSRASPYKTEGNIFGPLTADAKENVQREVDTIASRFIGAVAKARMVSIGDVEKNYGRGRTLFANDAKRAGMVDRIGTLADALHSAPAKRMGAKASAPKQDNTVLARLRRREHLVRLQVETAESDQERERLRKCGVRLRSLIIHVLK
jgi:ClpP class serine protease